MCCSCGIKAHEDAPIECPDCLSSNNMDTVPNEWRFYCSGCKTYWYASADYLTLVKERPSYV